MAEEFSEQYIDASAMTLSQYSILLATPNGDGKYDQTYVYSLLETVITCRNLGINIERAEFPFCADLPLARAKLFGKFLRSEHTHMMMIDSDMGFAAADVFRMLEFGEEFVAAAGPKKLSTIEFAYGSQDDYRNPVPVIPQENGLFEITDVGGAFVLISRSCAEKMAKAYHERLGFDGDNGEDEYAVYDPIVLNRARRLSEDYAFCWRWRKIGGKVLILPDIKLKHTGTNTWIGALSDLMQKKLEETNEKAA